MFYAVPTHEFFSTIGLRSNSLHPSSTSSLLLPSDNYKSQDHRSQVCILHNHVFYAVLTHEFFSTIGLRSNNLHRSSISSLQPSSTSRQSQITRSHIIRNKKFFYRRTNHRSQRCLCVRYDMWVPDIIDKKNPYVF